MRYGKCNTDENAVKNDGGSWMAVGVDCRHDVMVNCVWAFFGEVTVKSLGV